LKNARSQRQVLIHIDSGMGAKLDPAKTTAAPTGTSTATNLRWYCEWIADQAPSARVLAPYDLQDSLGDHAPVFAGLPVAWYRPNDRIDSSRAERKGRTWIVNAAQLPMIDWECAAEEARQADADVVAFEAAERSSENRYEERVLVGDNQEVLRFERHYGDSPVCADLWSGESAFLVVNHEHGPAVLVHLVQRGWSLESIGAITRRFSLRWSSAPCAHSMLNATGELVGDLGLLQDNTDAAAELDPATANGTKPAGDGTSPALLAASTMLASRRAVDEDTLARDDHTYVWLKRAVDVTGSALGLLGLLPLMIVLAILVRLTSRGPVFFAHRRQGLGGAEFYCLKFRSMTLGADAMQDELRGQNEVDGPQFRIEEDPRMTPIGEWLRKYNLDELPQLINVLRGQMSFVGPRPSPDRENQLCPAWRRTRLSVKPGITGLWQVLRRRECPHSDFQEWIYYDVEYARHRSLWLDWQILIHTPVAMFAPKHLERFAAKLERADICKGSDWLAPRDEVKS